MTVMMLAILHDVLYVLLLSCFPFGGVTETLGLYMIFTAQRSNASAVLGAVILFVCLDVRLSICLSHVCFMAK